MRALLPPASGGSDLGPGREGAGDGSIWRAGAFHADEWYRVADEDPLPAGSAIVSKKRWLADRQVLASRTAALGLRIEPGEDIDGIADDIGRFPLIALSFPKFSDGRSFSAARILREKYRFAGELRAVGNVLADQIPFMCRVGFDSFEVTHAPTRKALAEGRIADVSLHYQPSERGRRAFLR